MARRDRPDHYSERARREGFSARSVYKLQEIQKKHRVIRSGGRVLDVGAAPGSWSQYVRTLLGPDGTVVAVDLSPLPDLEGLSGVVPITGDIYDEDVITKLEAAGPFDAVLSDAAPKTTGNRLVDTSRSAAIVEHVMWLCPRLLAEGGSLVAKLFQGGDEQTLLSALRAGFSEGHLVKPRATRSESFEVFLVGKGYTRQL